MDHFAKLNHFAKLTKVKTTIITRNSKPIRGKRRTEL